MKQTDILKYIEQPGLIKTANPEQFKVLVRNYPYYQTAHILLLKCLKDQYPSEFESQLQQSSIYISDRDLLYRFLNKNFESVKLENDKIDQKKEISSEIVVEETKQSIKTDDSKLLKNKNIRRKINDSFEGMGENISETIMSQLDISSLKKDDKLEYSSEIYFIEEERSGKNNVITIDAIPDLNKNLNKKRDILQIEESELSQNDAVNEEIKDDESFELIESENDVNIPQEELKQNEQFDINHYIDHDILKKDNDLITKFLIEKPRIEPKEINEENVDISQESVKEDQELLSETLAKVYIKQGLFEKAIHSYERLCLKYPEKNAYFASQIKILNEKINKQ